MFEDTEKWNFIQNCVSHLMAAYELVQGSTLWLLLFLFSLAKNFQQSYIESGGTSSSFCNKVFASWDYCICDENTAKIKSQNIVQTVKVCALLRVLPVYSVCIW